MRKRNPEEVMRDWFFEILINTVGTEIIDRIYRCETIKDSDDSGADLLGLSCPHRGSWTIYIATTQEDPKSKSRKRIKIPENTQTRILIHERVKQFNFLSE